MCLVSFPNSSLGTTIPEALLRLACQDAPDPCQSPPAGIQNLRICGRVNVAEGRAMSSKRAGTRAKRSFEDRRYQAELGNEEKAKTP